MTKQAPQDCIIIAATSEGARVTFMENGEVTLDFMVPTGTSVVVGPGEEDGVEDGKAALTGLPPTTLQ